jgi:DNA-binding response OmpR family regulator
VINNSDEKNSILFGIHISEIMVLYNYKDNLEVEVENMENRIIPENYNILVVDDDIYINEMIQLYLKNKGFHIVSAYSGPEALNFLQANTFHLTVLDIMLPEMSGWEVCQSIREYSEMPILMLTAKGENEDKVKGLSLGADDYLVKPFDPNELVARVISLLRRSYAISKKVINRSFNQFGELRIDTFGRTVSIGNDFIDLTPREFQLLLILTQHPNQVFDRQQLLDLVWGEDYMGEDRVVDVFVTRLRSKLTSDQDRWKIETIRGIGYKFKVEE